MRLTGRIAHSKPYLEMEECYPIAQYVSWLTSIFHIAGRSGLTFRPHRNVTAFLNQPATRATLGIDPAHSTFITHNAFVQARFERNADRVAFRAEDSIGALLERGVRVLLYVGVNDFVCNWVRCPCSPVVPAILLMPFIIRRWGRRRCLWALSGRSRTHIGVRRCASGRLRERSRVRCAVAAV